MSRIKLSLLQVVDGVCDSSRKSELHQSYMNNTNLTELIFI